VSERGKAVSENDPFQFERPCWIHGVKEILLNTVRMWEWRRKALGEASGE
jgi:hypothetical protein